MNPFDGGGSKQGAPNKTIAPVVPAYDGKQFAADSMTPEEISVTRDSYWDEIPADRTNHADATPGHSNSLYVGRQYDTIVRSPTGNQYGAAATDLGQSPSKKVVENDVTKAGRGPES
jgi:hypothetical protein